MDEDRKIRFLIAPLFFIASISWGLSRDSAIGFSTLFPGFKVEFDNLSNLIALIAGGGISIFALGFIIGTTAYVILRPGFLVRGKFGHYSTCHEISFPESTLGLIWRGIKIPGALNHELQLYIGTTFDHDILRCKNEGVHRWLVRRWNAFSIAVTSITGLLLSLLTGYLFGIHFGLNWWIPVIILCTIFGISAYFAWNDVMNMISFQASRKYNLETNES